MNEQPPERKFNHPDGIVDLHHIFPTIQGEGPFAGTPAVFVRLAGCNLQCPWCDTEYTARRQMVTPNELLVMVTAATPAFHMDRVPGPLVVITGGEPFRQNLSEVTKVLFNNGYRVQIETNGVFYDPHFPYGMATIVCSPKTPKIHHHLEPHLAALKYVLQNGRVAEDGLPADTMGTDWAVHRPSQAFRGEIYVQPLDEAGAQADASEFCESWPNRQNLSAAVKSAMRHGYRLCIQTHKLTGVE